MSRSSDFGVILWPRLTTQPSDSVDLTGPSLSSGFLGTFVVRHSGATVRDLYPIPYSPLTVIKGTLSWFQARRRYALARPWQSFCTDLRPGSRRRLCGVGLSSLSFSKNRRLSSVIRLQCWQPPALSRDFPKKSCSDNFLYKTGGM